MLKLERVEIAGFKSFVDRTEVLFPEGITAIVGPNGCGKSNIGDAINWVLGEQSARMLRGKEMSDVIFAGSEGRKPDSRRQQRMLLKELCDQRRPIGMKLMTAGMNESNPRRPGL